MPQIFISKFHRLTVITLKMIRPVTVVVNIVRRCFVSLVCVKPLCYWSLRFFHSSS